MLRKLIFAAACLTGLARLVPAQTPDLILNPGSSYVDVGRGIPWGTPFNRTYVLVPNSPNASVCVYVVNNNPTNAHTFTTSISQTADSQVSDFSHNGGRFSSVPLLNMPASVSASSMVSGFSQSTAAAKVAISFSATSAAGGSPDTADVFIVQTTSGTCGTAVNAQPVQGAIAPGTTGGLNVNPIIIGGTDPMQSNAMTAVNVVNNSDNGSTPVNGLPIGGVDSLGAGTFSNMRFPAGKADGPLAVAVFGLRSTGNAAASVEGSQFCPTGCGLFVNNAGYFNSTSGTITSNISLPLWCLAAGCGSNNQAPAFQACRIDVQVTTVTGTTPTLDVWVQDSANNTNFTDRIHFNQFTAAGFQQSGLSSTSANMAVANYTSKTIAAGTIISGPIGPYGQLAFTVGGTTPSFSVFATIFCN